MTLRIVCDRLMCGRYEDTRFGDPPNSWVTVGRDGQHRDSSLRSVYCSTRCAVLALGGAWTIENITEADLQDADTRTIPWPPSEELVERVAWVMRDHFYPDSGPYVPRTWREQARAVLDVIGGAGDE